MGGLTTVNADDDVVDDGLECTLNTCNMGVPQSGPAAMGITCDDDGGAVCDDSGNCVECNEVADCPSDQPYECNNNICVPLTCINETLDVGETDVDCGGPICPKCADNLNCLAPGDCESGVCEDKGMGLKCQPPSCTDGVVNGDESDVDCGGLFQPEHDCPRCKTGQDCTASTDCIGGECSGMGGAVGTCLPNCFDTEQNGTETDIDCGGACMLKCDPGQGCGMDVDCVTTAYCDVDTCAVKKIDGTMCGGGNECVSTFCTDSVCCDQMCSGLCQACTAMIKGQGSDGACGNILTNTDPGNECAGAGVCDGGGACKKGVGDSCMNGTECASNNCVDGVCCSTSCSGPANACKACSMAKTGQADGTCANITSGSDPDSECPGATTCNGGSCNQIANGDACTLVDGSECASGSCVDGVCCNSACAGTCQACSNAKTGQANGVCNPVTVGTDPDSECTGNGGTDVCAGAGICKQALGTSCGNSNSLCATGFCTDGVCCASACGATCQACTMALTGQTDGTCAFVTPNTESTPGDCSGNQACNAAGLCKGGTGDTCAVNGDCASNMCVSLVCQ